MDYLVQTIMYETRYTLRFQMPGDPTVSRTRVCGATFMKRSQLRGRCENKAGADN